MTCYFRHLKDVFKRAGVEVTRENKRELNRIIHTFVGLEYKNCSPTWREVKKRIVADEGEFIAMLKELQLSS